MPLDELRVLHPVVEDTLVWPSQVSLVLGRLFPAKSKGDRVIGALTTFTRVWSKAREPAVQAWSLANEPSWGAAVKRQWSLAGG
eukprot:6823920-Pyramimonas_sp.AAC.1